MATKSKTVIKPSCKVYAKINEASAILQFWQLGTDAEAWGIWNGQLCRLDTLPGFVGYIEEGRTHHAH